MKLYQLCIFLVILFCLPAAIVLFTTYFVHLMSAWDLNELRGWLCESSAFWMFYIFLGHTISMVVALYYKEETLGIKGA